jgi:hypothetical protein
MSPEHLGAGDITAASDVFSLGSVLAFAATGRGPFDALEDVAIMGRILAHDPVLGSLETPLRDGIGACLTKDPAKRPTLRALLDYFAAPGGTLIPSPDKAQPSAKWDNTAPQWSLPLTVTMGSADELANARPAGIRFARVQESQRPASADAMGSAKADDGDPPRRSVRILSPDVRLRLWEIRAAIMAVGFFVAAALTGSWEIALSAATLAGIADTIYRSRTAASHSRADDPPAAIRRTRRQLTLMRRAGYLALEARPVPNSRKVIDHLVIGPTGIYAIDSQRWDPLLPIRTLNGQRLFHGLESKEERIDRAGGEAQQVSELVSEALGTEIFVQPALAVYGARIPWSVVTVRGVDVFDGPGLRRYLRRRTRTSGTPMTTERVRVIYGTLDRMLPVPRPEASRS